MAHIWRGSGSLTRVHDDDISPGEVFEATDAELSAFGDVIEVADESEPTQTDSATTEEDADSVGEPATEGGETPLQGKDYSELRDMAMDADTDEINGRSSKADIIAYFSE